MKHGRQHERKLLAFIDGDLVEDETADMERHVRECPRCKERAAEYRANLMTVHEAFGDVPPADATPSSGAIGSRAGRARTKRIAVRGGVIGACGAAVLLAVLLRTPSEPAHVPIPKDLVAVERADLARINAEIAALREELRKLKASPEVVLAPLPNILDVEVAAIVVESGKHLEREFGLTDAAKVRYQFAAEMYGDSPPGREAKGLLARLEN